MLDAEIQRWDATEAAARLRSGEVTPAEVEASARGAIDRHDPTLNAVADLLPPDGTAAAMGEGRFAGVPFLVKELLAYPGLPWTMGSRLMAGNVATEASAYVRRLQEAGLRVLGSTTSSELGLLGSTESELRGITVNPWGAGLSAGGSSGGAAAAVAAGLIPFAHASDAGGSIRYPAAMCGLFGFLPSAGRCVPSGPEAGGLAALVVDHVISRSVRDSAGLLAETERRGPDVRHQPIGFVAGPGTQRLRIGVAMRSIGGQAPDPAVRDVVLDAARACEDLGHQVVEAEPVAYDAEAVSHAFFASAALTITAMATMVAPMLGRPVGPAELEPFTLELLAWGRTLPDDTPERIASAFADASATYRRQFAGCDVLLSPTVTEPPWPVGTLAPDLGREELVARTEQLIGYTPIQNITGSPGMSLPLGTAGGLPVGVHVAGLPGDDARLLGLAYELEAARPWRDRRPDLAWIEEASCPRS